MHQMKRILCWLTTFLAVFGISRTVQAQLTIENAGFEDESVAPGGYTYTLGAWVAASENPWISNGYYADEAQPPSSALVTQEAIVFQDLTNHTFEAGTTYTFSMDTGARTGPGNDQWSLRIYDATSGSATNPLAVASGTTPLDGAWHSVNVQYTATLADAGHVIGIGLGGVANGYYNYYDNAAVMTSATGTAPSITQDPQDQTAVLGDAAGVTTFTVSAVGSTPLAYQWRLGGSAISGATNATLTITGAGTDDVGNYDVVVQNSVGSATSQSAALSLTIPDIEPADQTVVFGGTAGFSMTLPGTGYAYQWKRNGTDVGGATAATLELAGALQADAGAYSVDVTFEGDTLTSTDAALDVTVPPVDPVAKVGLVGDTIDLSVDLPGTGYAYQWKKGGVNLAGETGQTLILSPVALSDTGDYTLAITLGSETVTSGPAVVTAAALGTQPYDTLVTSHSPLTYWRLGETSGIVATDQTGFFDATYAFGADVVLGESGVTLGDSDTSASFPGATNALVEAWPDNPADINPSVFSVEFWAVSTGGSGFRSPVTSRDFLSETDIAGWTFYANGDNVWEFRIGQGVVTSNSAWNQILGPRVVENQWTHLVGTYDGTDMKFYVDGALVGTLPGVAYVPQDYNPLWIGAGLTEDPDNVGDFFWVGKVDEVALYDRALTGTEVIDHYAAAFPASTAPPEIIVNPASISRLAGEAATFDVGVHTAPPVTYQWQLGGVDIPGATERILTLPGGLPPEAGMYRAMVGNSFGFSTSGAAELEICSGTCDVPVMNGGFDDATGVLADAWNDNGGSVRGGVEGGFGWTASYYTGGFPTDDTFATTVAPGPIRQDLPGRSWVAGVTYTLTVDLFSSDTYGASNGATINWRLALTGDGETVAEDTWYSDEFETAGETVPPGHLISIVPGGGPGLTTATLVYTATAADAGKALGIELGGDVTLGNTQGDDYYGHMDSVLLTAETAAATATMHIEWIGGNIVLSWDEAGTLQESENLLGTWSDVPGATSPTVVIPVSPQRHFRLGE